ncbi:hypothetical protein AOQ71_04560 [Bradyrhizobium manausense]|uniref:Uncharacterized protein n=1 Tax=Bradyrhizobium manausense TaxID=989370 RepID=A0A0R3E3D7_9BRAD|nr:hypothetical protein AOQ71_04560 [Bradyrhizobium manausense]
MNCELVLCAQLGRNELFLVVLEDRLVNTYRATANNESMNFFEVILDSIRRARNARSQCQHFFQRRRQQHRIVGYDLSKALPCTDG